MSNYKEIPMSKFKGLVFYVVFWASIAITAISMSVSTIINQLGSHPQLFGLIFMACGIIQMWMAVDAIFVSIEGDTNE